jgi:hypothetical protein
MSIESLQQEPSALSAHERRRVQEFLNVRSEKEDETPVGFSQERSDIAKFKSGREAADGSSAF